MKAPLPTPRKRRQALNFLNRKPKRKSVRTVSGGLPSLGRKKGR